MSNNLNRTHAAISLQELSAVWKQQRAIQEAQPPRATREEIEYAMKAHMTNKQYENYLHLKLKEQKTQHLPEDLFII